jgi:CBS domain-containing protein
MKRQVTRLNKTTIEHLIEPIPLQFSADTPTSDVLNTMIHNQIELGLVMEEREPLAFITSQDFMALLRLATLSDSGIDLQHLPVGQLVEPVLPPPIERTCSLTHAIGLFKSYQSRYLLVVEESKLIGMLTTDQVLSSFIVPRHEIESVAI